MTSLVLWWWRFRAVQSSNLAFSIASSARRNTMPTLILCAESVYGCSLPESKQKSVGILFLRAQSIENLFCLSSARKDVFLSSSVLVMCSIWRWIRTQLLKTRLVSKFGIQMSSSQNLLGEVTTVRSQSIRSFWKVWIIKHFAQSWAWII